MISLGLVLLMVIGAYLLALQPFSRRTAEPPVTAPPVTTPIEGIVCKPVSGLPVFRKATCLKHEEAQDDGLIQTENTYLIAAPAGDVRRFYEEAITRNDWTVQEASFDAEDSSWEYTVIQGTRRLKIEVEASQTPDNAFTKFKIAEK
jgi:hypothetical protein